MSNLESKGLTMTIIFEAESANYGEGVGNVTALKKISRGTGESFSYMSRQALRYNMVEQMGIDTTNLGLDGDVIQFAPETNIKDYPEIDLFGYMKTVKKDKSSKKDKAKESEEKETSKGGKTRTRAAIVRLSNAIALESYNSDLDFLTNKGLLDRYNEQNSSKQKDGGQIAQSEIHKSFYSYTIAVDLDKVGIDINDNVNIDDKEKAERINKFLDTVKFLYRDIKGRRENLSPIFVVGGVYDIKNPFFENKVLVDKNKKIKVGTIQEVLNLDNKVKTNTTIGFIKGIFNNCDKIERELGAKSIGEFFDNLKQEINQYYGVN